MVYASSRHNQIRCVCCSSCEGDIMPCIVWTSPKNALQSFDVKKSYTWQPQTPGDNTIHQPWKHCKPTTSSPTQKTIQTPNDKTTEVPLWNRTNYKTIHKNKHYFPNTTLKPIKQNPPHFPLKKNINDVNDPNDLHLPSHRRPPLMPKAPSSRRPRSPDLPSATRWQRGRRSTKGILDICSRCKKEELHNKTHPKFSSVWDLNRILGICAVFWQCFWNGLDPLSWNNKEKHIKQ